MDGLSEASLELICPYLLDHFFAWAYPRSIAMSFAFDPRLQVPAGAGLMIMVIATSVRICVLV